MTTKTGVFPKVPLLPPPLAALGEARADLVVRLPEVREKIEPFADQIDGNSKTNKYPPALRRLESGGDAPVRVTGPARNAIAALLEGARIDGVYHRSPLQIKGVSWSAGMGIAAPDDTYTGPSVNFTAKFQRPDAVVKTKVKVDEAKRVVTVYVEGIVEGPQKTQQLSKPQPVRVPVSFPAHIGDDYAIVIRDGSPASANPGKVLGKGMFTNHIPMVPHPHG